MDNQDTLTQVEDFASSEVESKNPSPVTEAPQVEVADKPQKEEMKAAKTEDWKKNYDSYRSFADRRFTESQKELKALKAQMEQLAPIRDAYKQRELQQLHQTNPEEAARKILAEQIQQAMSPYANLLQQQQEHLAMQGVEKTATDTINYLQSTYGPEAYSEVSPIMRDILSTTQEQYGQEVSDLLARNPDHLFMTAFGMLAFEKIKNYTSQQQQGNQNKQALERVATGVSKPNKSFRPSNTNSMGSKEDIEKAAFDFLQNLK